MKRRDAYVNARMVLSIALMFLLAAQWLLLSEIGQGHEPTSIATRPDLSLPAPGTYRLERIMAVPEGVVLNSDGRATKLSSYTTGQITVLSLIYTHCADANGCPLARVFMQSLKKSIQQRPQMVDRVRLVSLSFDPQHDTPEVMRAYGGIDATSRQRPRWYFLTTRSSEELRPLLTGFGQDVSILAAGLASTPTTALTHVLKIFLIDPHGDVREIYSTSFFDPKALLNDIQTLLLEDDRQK